MSVSSIGGGGSSPDDYPNYRAHQAEKEAENRVNAAQEKIKKAEIEENTSIDALRDRYEKTYEIQNSNQNQALEEQKMKGYEQLRDLQRTQFAEYSKIQKDGQEKKNHIEGSTRDYIRTIDSISQDQVKQELRSRSHQLEFEKNRSEEELATIKDRTNRMIEKTKEESQDKIQRIQKENQSAIDQMLESSQENIEKSQSQNESFQKRTIREQREGLEEIYQHANQKLQEVRRDTAQKIAAYTSRQSDPFYKMITLDAELKDEGHEFVLTAKVPEYEQGNISATVRGDNLVLSGYRRNEETLKDDNGHKQGTTSYQSFHETFPLNWPVDAKNLTRQQVGEQVIIRVPKQGQYASREIKALKHSPDHLVEPNFPKNLGKST